MFVENIKQLLYICSCIDVMNILNYLYVIKVITKISWL